MSNPSDDRPSKNAREQPKLPLACPHRDQGGSRSERYSSTKAPQPPWSRPSPVTATNWELSSMFWRVAPQGEPRRHEQLGGEGHRNGFRLFISHFSEARKHPHSLVYTATL